jgi:hypothetical protein
MDHINFVQDYFIGITNSLLVFAIVLYFNWYCNLRPEDKTTRLYKLYHKVVNQEGSFFNKEKRVLSTFPGFRSHSHKWIIFQPSFFKASTAFVSLAMLEFILSSHHSVLFFGYYKISAIFMSMPETTMNENDCFVFR